MKNKISKIIDDWDPIDLFPHAPKDEYEDEINLVINLLYKSKDVDFLAAGIKNIFLERFGSDVFTKDYNECVQVAEKIIRECSER